MKAASVLALLVALSGPTTVTKRDRPIGVVIVVDKSSGLNPAQAAYTKAVAETIKRDQRTQWMRFVDVIAGMRLRDAAAMVPDGYSPRLVLISDGNTAMGDLSRTILEMQQMHVAVETTPLTVDPLVLESLALPDRAYTGEQLAIEIAVSSPREAMGQIRIHVGRDEWPSQPVHLQRGHNLIRVQQRAPSPGAELVTGEVSAGDVGQVHFAGLVQVGRARVAYVSTGTSAPAGNLLRSLREQGIEIAQKSRLSRDSLAGVQLMVLSSQDLTSLTEAQKEQIARYVSEGGGLLLFGGPEHPHKEEVAMDALDRALPASPAPPENSGDKCVVVLIDRSSSMEGEKIRMARHSVQTVADTLSSQDTLGVLAFNHAFRWVVPVQKFKDRRSFVQQLSNLTTEGGTEIPPALSAAYHAALLSKAKYRHLVLVTDGISEEGDSIHLAKEASQQGIAISTIGIGAAVNRGFLEAVAKSSGGRSYFLANPEDLKRITLKDVEDYTGSNSVDGPFRPTARQGIDTLAGVDMRRAPALMHYTRYSTKAGVETVLGIGKGGGDPLYVRWQYGLGRVGLLTSDRLGDWATSWRGPEGLDRLWANLARDLFSHTKHTEAVATANHGTISIKYTVRPGSFSGQALPQIRVVGSQGFSKSVPLLETAPSSYAAEVSIGDQSGIFQIQPEPPSSDFPATALLVEQGGERASGRDALRLIAQQTGGAFYTDLASRPAWKSTPTPHTLELWPALVSLAIGLNLVELAVRRKRTSLRSFRRPKNLSVVSV